MGAYICGVLITHAKEKHRMCNPLTENPALPAYIGFALEGDECTMYVLIFAEEEKYTFEIPNVKFHTHENLSWQYGGPGGRSSRTFPREGPLVPYEGPVLKCEGALIPYEGPVLNREGLLVLYEGPVLHREGLLVLCEGPVLHREGPLVQYEGPVLHREGLLVRYEVPLLHREGLLVLCEGPVLHRECPQLLPRTCGGVWRTLFRSHTY